MNTIHFFIVYLAVFFRPIESNYAVRVPEGLVDTYEQTLLENPESLENKWDYIDDTVPNGIRRNGYPCEEHTVMTEDGYILTLHRIPRGKHENQSQIQERKTPVLLQHGLLCSSGTWTINTPDNAAAFLLADLGYDVWLGNVRGNTYSRKHVTMTPEHKQFWEFSFDEMGYYDVPAMIDYVLEKSHHKQLYYMGHSMGTTMFFGAMSRRPEYNSKIKEMFALAPVGTVSYIKTPVRFLGYIRNLIQEVLERNQMYELLGQNSYSIEASKMLCDHLFLTEFMCSRVTFLLIGFDGAEFDTETFTRVMNELQSGTSIYTILHYVQEYESQKFRRYDYGSEGNLKRYGTSQPPLYNVSAVTAPVTLFHSPNDYLADTKDVEFLTENLPNIRRNWTVKDKNFNHLDFLWAVEAYKYVYKPIIDVLEKF